MPSNSPIAPSHRTRSPGAAPRAWRRWSRAASPKHRDCGRRDPRPRQGTPHRYSPARISPPRRCRPRRLRAPSSASVTMVLPLPERGAARMRPAGMAALYAMPRARTYAVADTSCRRTSTPPRRRRMSSARSSAAAVARAHPNDDAAALDLLVEEVLLARCPPPCRAPRPPRQRRAPPPRPAPAASAAAPPVATVKPAAANAATTAAVLVPSTRPWLHVGAFDRRLALHRGSFGGAARAGRPARRARPESPRARES